MFEDNVIGSLLCAINGLAFVFFFLWVLVSPFVDRTHSFQNFFPPREIALLGVAVATILIWLLVSGTFVAAQLSRLFQPSTSENDRDAGFFWRLLSGKQRGSVSGKKESTSHTEKLSGVPNIFYVDFGSPAV